MCEYPDKTLDLLAKVLPLMPVQSAQELLLVKFQLFQPQLAQ